MTTSNPSAAAVASIRQSEAAAHIRDQTRYFTMLAKLVDGEATGDTAELQRVMHSLNIPLDDLTRHTATVRDIRQRLARVKEIEKKADGTPDVQACTQRVAELEVSTADQIDEVLQPLRQAEQALINRRELDNELTEARKAARDLKYDNPMFNAAARLGVPQLLQEG